jgi:hypothetical protein
MSPKADQLSLQAPRGVTFTAADLDATIALYKQASRVARLARPPSEAAVESGPRATGRPTRLNFASD